MGLVVSPVGLALTSLSTIPVVGMLFGLSGAILLVIHGIPGYFMVVSAGLVEPGSLLTGRQQLYIELFNGILWSTVYGLLGFYFDSRRLS